MHCDDDDVPYPRRTEFMEARRAQPKAYLLMEGRFAGAIATGMASVFVLMAISLKMRRLW
jgi:hypothetical protein